MPSLKEIKGRIGSVKSTLKITSAMKLVASSKLRKAQLAVQAMAPYERQLHVILEDLMADYAAKVDQGKIIPTEGIGGAFVSARTEIRNVALVALSSNSSLCGGFNANAIKLTLETVRAYEQVGIGVTVYAVGRKMAEAMRRVGIPPMEIPNLDFLKLSEKPDYGRASLLATELMDGFLSGRFDKVDLVWNHFVSTSLQQPVRETFLPFSLGGAPDPESSPDSALLHNPVRANAPLGESSGPASAPGSAGIAVSEEARRGLFIVEPSTAYEVELLLPKVLKLKIFTVLLDSSAAEHAARTVAMQTATDNGEDLLQELTLEYNKGRQQKITSEILDLVGGSMK